MHGAWHFFLNHSGLTAVVVAVATFITTRLLLAILHELRVLADRLDTRTPGGLRDLLDHLDDHGARGEGPRL